MHPAYRAIVLARASAAYQLAVALGLVDHDVTKGQLRELVLDELLRPLLPSDIGVGSGLVVSADTQSSSQMDVVIYDRRVLPPLLVGSHVGIFPVESVAYTIEVKSRFDEEDLMKAHEAARLIHEMPVLPGHFDPVTEAPIAVPFHSPVASILAFGTRVSDMKPVIDRYDAVRGSDHACIWSICIVGKGYWHRNETRGQWVPWGDKSELGDLVGFLMGVLNSIPKALRSRGQPKFGPYVADDSARADKGQ